MHQRTRVEGASETGDVKMQRVTGGRLVADEVADRELRDILVKRLSDAGIEVVMDAEEAQRVLDEANGDARMQAKKRAKETASIPQKEEYQHAVISFADGAKVRNNLDGTKEKYENTSGLAELQEVNGNDIRYLRRGNGEVYGFVKGGRIYIDPDRVNAETPIHEYAHLWAYAMRRMNPKEWANIVELMKESPVWEEVKQYYPELESDEEIADEVLATYSGRLGAEKLREKQREVMAEKGNSLMEKAHAVAALERVKDALKRFWKGLAEFFNLHYTSAEEVADRVLYDLLGGVNPLDYGRESLESVNRRFNEELESYMSGMMATNDMLHLGNPHGVMQIFMPSLPIVMRQRILNKGSVKKHNVDVSSLTDMPKYLSNPIFVFQRNDNTLGVLTEMQDRDGKSVCVAIELDRKIQDGGEILEVNDVRPIHGRDVADIVYPIVQNGTLRWVDKKKGLDYLSSASQYVQQEIDKQALDSAAKIVENFENPSVEGEKALDYLRISAPIAEAQDNQELPDVAKIVENFENPSVEVENISDEEDLLFRVREEEAMSYGYNANGKFQHSLAGLPRAGLTRSVSVC